MVLLVVCGLFACFAFFSINSEGQEGQTNTCLFRGSWEFDNLWVLSKVCVFFFCCFAPPFSSSCFVCVSASLSYFSFTPPPPITMISATLAISGFFLCLSLLFCHYHVSFLVLLEQHGFFFCFVLLICFLLSFFTIIFPKLSRSSSFPPLSSSWLLTLLLVSFVQCLFRMFILFFVVFFLCLL